MLRHIFFLFFAFFPLINCQLIIGMCPIMDDYVKNLDYERYSGQWYVIAQSEFHPMKAVNCQKVTYSPRANGMTILFNTSKNYEQDQRNKNGTLKIEGDNKGELRMSLDNSPRSLHFRVMYVEYPKVAVEYTCLDGVINHIATITVLHREPVQLTDLESGLRELNLSSIVPDELKHLIQLVSHTNCIN